MNVATTGTTDGLFFGGTGSLHLIYFVCGIPISIKISARSTQVLPSTEDSSTSAPVGDARARAVTACGFPKAIFIQGGIGLASFGRT